MKGILGFENQRPFVLFIPSCSFMGVLDLPPAHKRDDLDLVAFRQGRLGVLRAFDDDAVALDRDDTGIDLQMQQEGVHGQGRGNVRGVAVQRNSHAAPVSDIKRFSDANGSGLSAAGSVTSGDGLAAARASTPS